MRRWGSSTGNGAGWSTRVALSGASSHTSSVASMNSSAVVVASDGRPSAVRFGPLTARSKRPLLAITTRSVRSRSTGLAGCLNDPQAQLPPAPRALRQIDLAAQQQPQAVLQDPDDVGRQGSVGLAAEVGHVDGDAAAGLELGDALGEDVFEHREVLDVGGGDVALAKLLLVGLAGEVGRRGDHQRHRRRPHAVHRSGVADVDLIDDAGRLDGVVAAHGGGGEPGVEAAGIVVLAAGHAERGRGRRSLALRVVPGSGHRGQPSRRSRHTTDPTKGV